jgi:hypothetical protein
VGGFGAGHGVANARSIFAGDVHGGVAGAVINDENVVAGIERLQAAAEPQSVVFGVHYCRNRGHVNKRVYAKQAPPGCRKKR